MTDKQSNISRLAKAIEWAHKKHYGQLYGDHPYTYHLNHVASCSLDWAERIGLTSHERHIGLVASWLHDIVEDTDATVEEVRGHFGDETADVVDRVTNPDFLDGRKLVRREKHAIAYPRIAENPIAIFVKLCDRIANVTHSRESGSGLIKMYIKEHKSFRDILKPASPDSFEPMWEHLDKLLKYKGS
jgi:(p)ppGpp synthase/HD superfamily hydrolase